MIWRGFVVLAVLLVGLLSIFLGRRGTEREAAAPTRQPLQPGYYMTDARIAELGPDGRPVYRVEADSIVQNPQDSSIVMKDLALAYRAGNAQEWTLTAQSGYVPPGSRTIDLSGDVRIVGQPRPADKPGIIRTEQLSVDPQTDVASTQSRVDIEWDRGRLSAVGLQADLNDERLRLESSVHGRFVP